MSNVSPAFQGELMLAGWTQNHNSGAKVSFWLSDEGDLEAFRHLTTRRGNTAGQRFMAVLVQIGDDDQPIMPGEDAGMPSGSKLAKAAALLCKSDHFQQYVAKVSAWQPTSAEERDRQAADLVRRYCGIESRSDLDKSPTAAALYQRLLGEFQAWRTAVGLGGSYERRD